MGRRWLSVQSHTFRRSVRSLSVFGGKRETSIGAAGWRANADDILSKFFADDRAERQPALGDEARF